MSFDEFLKSLEGEGPEEDMAILLKALWYDKKDNWEKAHGIVENLNSTDSAWIHAYLHRKEGDIGNASYWYRRANQKLPQITLDEEWKQLTEIFLKIL